MSRWRVGRLEKSRELVRLRAAFFAVGVQRLRPVVVPGLTTMAVDSSSRLYYDPECLKLPLREIASILVHELMHILDKHSERAKACGVITQEDAALWNIGADISLFQLMRSGGWNIEGHLNPDQFGFPRDKPVEVYYRLLKDTKKVNCPNPKSPAPGQGNCGSCASGVQADWEQPPESSDDIEARRELVRRLVGQAMELHQKARGRLPDGYELLLDDILKPPVIPWQRLFAGALRGGIVTAGKIDFSRQRPSRRQQCTPDFIRPALIRPVPKVAVVVDTSASMRRDDLSAALAEIKGILRSTGISDGVTVLPCDAIVHDVEQVWSVKQIKLYGGGGTDMGAGLKKAGELKPRPDVVVVCTDGYTGWPEAKPVNCFILVLLVGNHAGLDSVPDWAKVLEVPRVQE